MPPYRVPFLFDRSTAPRYRLINVGTERLRGVRLDLLGRGVMQVALPLTLDPEQGMEVTIQGEDLALDGILLVRWLRPNGEEYLWRVAF